MQTLRRWKAVLRRALRRTKKATRLKLKSISGRIKHVWQVCILFFRAGITKIKQTFKSIIHYLSLLWKNLVLLIDLPLFYSSTLTFLVVGTYFFLDRFNYTDFIQSKIPMNDKEFLQSFVEWTGIPFGLIMSMIIARSWEKFEATGDVLAKEATMVFDLYENIKVFQLAENIKINELLVLIRRYIDHVTDEYENEHTNENRKLSGDSLLTSILETISSLSATTPESSKWHNQAQQVQSFRYSRLLIAKVHMPFSIRALLGISSLVWLGLLALINFENKWLTYTLFGSLSFITFTMISISFFFYEFTSIKRNDTLNLWKNLKNKTLQTKEQLAVK